jgi:hypothetical protein
MEEEVSPEEVRQCLDAISRHPKGASEARLPPGEVYGHTFSGGRYVYINFVKPSETPIGSTYRTWVVRFRGDKPEGVSYYRSRRGAAGDDTLPPDD